MRLAVANRRGWKQVPAEAVQPGALLVVLPGDRLPVDGVVVEGTSTLDESALTGEPLPVTRGPGRHFSSFPNTSLPTLRLHSSRHAMCMYGQVCLGNILKFE